ncbi:hypothetical protein FACS1894188_01510 [Clostridia bacterium]|nr:hypothetical protein FACS1894188_01510 [Clostridia bacterium]
MSIKRAINTKIFAVFLAAFVIFTGCEKKEKPTALDDSVYTKENKQQYEQIVKTYANIDILFDDSELENCSLLNEAAKSKLLEKINYNKQTKDDWEKLTADPTALDDGENEYGGYLNELNEKFPDILEIPHIAELNYIYYLDGGVIANVTNGIHDVVFVHLAVNRDGTVTDVSNGD